ncbi:putative porin [Blattabacterium cuenoti]|uniref:putative porin n=1 Tax=Blattabacterium cuenoti TaxID=1653831 RepID=UPI001EEB52AE|nr:putative porin [Blattabacterium cuenoti]
MHIDEKENDKFYHPTFQDYKYWTEEMNIKKTFLEKSFSIKKYYSQNFLKNDDISFFSRNGKDFLIIRDEKFMKGNFNQNMQKNIFFFQDPFFYREKIQYYDVKTPISEIFYINNSFNGEKILSAFFSKNFNEKINYSIEYRNSNLKNKIKKSKDLILTTLNYQDHDNYKLWGHYIYQKFETKEKEKIPKWDIMNYKNVFFNYKKLVHSRFYINFIQKIFSFKERSICLKNYVEYEKYFINYSFYDSYIFHNFEKKTMNHFYLRNGLFLIFNQKKINIEVGSIFDKIHYQLLSANDFKNKYINNLSIQTKVNYPISNVLNFYSNGKWIIGNGNKNINYQTDIMLNTFLFSKFLFLTRLNIDNIKNDQNINQKKTIDFSLSSEHGDKYSIFISRLNHFSMKKIYSYGFKIQTTHEISKFELNNIFFYHKCNDNPLIFSIPNFLSKNTIFYKNNYFNQALFIQTGFSFHYFSNPKKISYPFDFQSFFLEKEYLPIEGKISKTYFLDYFFNFKIYRTIFYFNIHNIDTEFISNPHNPHRIFIKTGFVWNLFT